MTKGARNFICGENYESFQRLIGCKRDDLSNSTCDDDAGIACGKPGNEATKIMYFIFIGETNQVSCTEI